MKFTFEYIKNQFETAIKCGYSIVRCMDYAVIRDFKITEKLIINRVDIDLSVKKAERLGKIFNELGIQASFFIRLHAKEYNPFSFENYRIIKFLIDSGHEIGYHSEVIEEAVIWGEEAEKCLIRDIIVINEMFGIKIKGVASHRGLSGINNLDFWKFKNAIDYNLLYEAYDWFDKMFYISDSEWIRWKCYNKGKRVPNDHRSLEEHLFASKHKMIYFLIHSDTYFDNHLYE